MHEIIHVVEANSLARTGRKCLEIEAVNDRALLPGYYFVLLASNTRLPPHRVKCHFGPFATLPEARFLHVSALVLGLVQHEEGIQSIAECRSIVRQPLVLRGPHFPGNNSPWCQEASMCAGQQTI